MIACVYKGLTTWHGETLSAWTMIAVVFVALWKYCSYIYHNKKPVSIAQRVGAFLVIFHVLIHAPFSIAYHCSHNDIVQDYDIKYLKRDACMIYISHFFMHLAISVALPWPISMISISVFGCACVHAVESLARTTHVDRQTFINYAIGFSWIFTLHYFPIMLQQKRYMIKYHTCLFIVIYILFKGAIVQRLMPKHLVDINIDNAIMHCALIVNNSIAHSLVTTT
jgi:hypothetical protein